MTGHCDNGCDAGWRGALCDKGLFSFQISYSIYYVRLCQWLIGNKNDYKLITASIFFSECCCKSFIYNSLAKRIILM